MTTEPVSSDLTYVLYFHHFISRYAAREGVLRYIFLPVLPDFLLMYGLFETVSNKKLNLLKRYGEMD